MNPNYTVLILTIGWIWIAIWLFKNAFNRSKRQRSYLQERIDEMDENSYS